MSLIIWGKGQNRIMNSLREYKCWGGEVYENNPIYVWAECMDDAVHLARIRNNDLDCFQWTGRERRLNEE